MPNDSNVLIGMKALAAYLGVHIDTVRKWEKLGMPINRSTGTPMMTKTVLDLWVSGGIEVEHVE